MSSGPPAHVRVVGKAITWLVARFPASWTLLRAPTRRFFDRLAPEWHKRIEHPQRLAPLEKPLVELGLSPRRILDLGTGTGAAAVVLAERYPEAQVTGVDVAKGMVRLARENVPAGAESRLRFEVADASALPFSDGEFDLVVQVSAPAFFAETARVLAPGGHLVVVSSLGEATPFHTPVGLLRSGFEREGLEWAGDGRAAKGTYYVLRRPAT